MARMSSIFTSAYLKAGDLPVGRDIHVTIERVEVKDWGDGDVKPIVFFLGKQKGLVLNRTNAEVLQDVLGDESDDWQGASVTLFTTKVQFNGRTVDAIRLRCQSRKQRAKAPVERAAPPPQSSTHNDQLEDEIPF